MSRRNVYISDDLDERFEKLRKIRPDVNLSEICSKAIQHYLDSDGSFFQDYEHLKSDLDHCHELNRVQESRISDLKSTVENYQKDIGLLQNLYSKLVPLLPAPKKSFIDRLLRR